MMLMTDVLKVLNSHRKDGIVVPTMMGWLGWTEQSTNLSLDIHEGGVMGKASSVGLGIAMACTDRKVMVLDGDGSLLMNLGALITISNTSPHNFYHFVLDNEIYAVTGGQPTPNATRRSIRLMGSKAGYAKTFEFDQIEVFEEGIADVLNSVGPVLINLKIYPESNSEEIINRLQGDLKGMKESIPLLRKALNS